MKSYPLAQWKRMVKAKHQLDRQDGWHECAAHDFIEALCASDAIQQVELPEYFRGQVEEWAFRRWVAGKLFRHEWFPRNAAILEQGAFPEQPIVWAAPKEVLDQLVNSCGLNFNLQASEEAWQKLVADGAVEARRSIKTVWRKKRRDSPPPFAWVQAVVPESGPMDGQLSEHRLVGFLWESWKQESEQRPLSVWCNQWEAGTSQDGELDVSRQEWVLPWLSPAAKLRFRIHAAGLVRWAEARRESDDGLMLWLLPQLLQALQAALVKAEDLPHQVVSTPSNLMGCELWNLVLASRGVRHRMVFYSVNTRTVLRKSVPQELKTAWQFSLWPEFWLWDEADRPWAEQIGSKQLEFKESIPFVDSGTSMPDIPERSVAVFDVQPHRDAQLVRLGYAGGFYSCDRAVRFLERIGKSAEKHGIKLVFKRKREIGSNANLEYRKFVNVFDQRPDVMQVSPDIAAARVIEKVGAVISFPFTSTAFQARSLGKASCFLDPLGDMVVKQPAARGLLIIQSEQELDDWLETVFK